MFIILRVRRRQAVAALRRPATGNWETGAGNVVGPKRSDRPVVLCRHAADTGGLRLHRPYCWHRKGAGRRIGAARASSGRARTRHAPTRETGETPGSSEATAAARHT